MPRVSLRKFLTLFRAVAVDDAQRGSELSENIQLTCLADDLRQAIYIYAGGGTPEAAVVGEHGFVTLECRNRRGLEVQQIEMFDSVPGFGEELRMWTSGVVPVITGAANILSVLRTTGLQGLPAAPLSIAQAGTILTAALPVTTFRMLDVHGFQWPFFINQGQFFNVASATANAAVSIGIRWRELRLFP